MGADDVLAALEALRCRCCGRLIVRTLAVVLAVGTLAALMMSVPAIPDPLVTAFACGLAALVGWAYWAHRPLAEYREAFGKRFVPALIREADGFRYEGSGRFLLEWISDSDIVPKCNFYDTDHMLSGLQSGIGVQLAEVSLTSFVREQFVGGRTGPTPEQTFGGLALLLSLRRSFAGRTAVIPDPGPLLRLFGSAPAWGNLAGPPVRTSHGRFEVFSTDADEAATLISQPMVERLAELANGLGKTRLRLVFYDAQILLLSPLKRGLFRAPSIFRRIDSGGDRRPVQAEMQTIQEIVDLLLRQVGVQP